MAFTTDQLNKLETAIAQGSLRVKYADKEVTYRSLDEMLRIRDLMRKSLGLVDYKGGRVTMGFSKGLDE